MLEDEVFDEYVNMVKSVINEHNISCSSDGICAFVDKSFGIACDMIYGMSVDFLVGQRKCLHCGSIQFERNMIAPASIIEIELPIVSHEKWKRIDCIQKKSIILDELKKDGFIV